MDGGRILRALMAGRMDRVRATALASQVGKFIAVIAGVIAIIRLDLFLTILAVFIYMAADAENNMVKTRALVLGRKVGEAMIKQFATLSVGDTLREASEKMLQGTQHDFPVMLGDTIAGVISQRQLSLGLLEAGPDGYVAGIMSREFPTASPDEALSDLLQRLEGPDAIMVIDPNATGTPPAGMLTQERIVEFLVQLNSHAGASGPWPTS
jgi:predicted transcriptional regulator